MTQKTKEQRKDAKTQRRKENPYNSSFFAPLRLRVFALILLLLLSALLRFHDLGVQSLWYDEGNSTVQSMRSFTEIADHAARDIHPPGYYWLLAGWRLITGESEFALRSLSAFASTLTVALTYAIGKRLFGTVGGLIAALFTALNTFSIYYAQEARMYALLALWGTASLYALIRLIERPTQTTVIALGLINAAGLWTQYAFPFFMIAQGVIVLLQPHPLPPSPRGEAERPLNNPPLSTWRGGIASNLGVRLIAFAAANIIAIALFAVWIPTALNQVTTWTQVRDAAPLSESLPTLIRWLAFGITADNIAPTIVIVLILFGLMFRVGEKRIAFVAPLAWTLIPVGLFLWFGLFREANLKFLLPAQIGMALWLARGILGVDTVIRFSDKIGIGRLRAPGIPGWSRVRDAVIPRLAAFVAFAWMALTLWNAIPPLYNDPQFQRPDYRAVAAAIASEAREGDAIILDAPNQDEVFRYYYDGDLPIYPLPVGLGGDDAATLAEAARIIDNHQRIFVVFYGENERDPNRVVETTLDQGAFELGDTWYGDVRLAAYVAPAPLDFVHDFETAFGGRIILDSYALNGRNPDDEFGISVRAGNVIQIQLAWHAFQPVSTRYKVFVQLLNADGVLVAQRDSEPGGGLAPTTTWTLNETVIDNHALLIPSDLHAGDYTLIMGLYDIDNPSARLNVVSGREVVGDALTLARVNVTER